MFPILTFNLPALLNIRFLVITCGNSQVDILIKNIHCSTDRVGVEGLGVHLVVVVLAGQVEQHAEGQVQVVGLAQSRLVTQSAQGKIFYGL